MQIARTFGLSVLLLVAIVLVVAAQLFGFPLDARAESTDTQGAAPKYVMIPVYYVTDRDKEGDSFGSNRRYTVNCLHHMYYGTAYLPVENKKNRKPGTTFNRLGWESAERVKAKVSRKEMIETETPEAQEKEFFGRLAKALDQSQNKHLCLFVHGAADPFEDAAADAAELAYYMECPIVVYSWPSVGHLHNYRVDEGNAEWSQEHYNTFIRDLESFSEQHPINVSLVAHSVGNRLLARSVPVLRRTNIIQDVALVSPDIDAETFKHYVMSYRQRGVKVRLYVSNRDKVLPFIQLISGGYYRLGEGVGSMLAMVSTPQQSFSAARQSVMRPFNHRHGSHRQGASEAQQPARLEKIDFTAIDKRWIGHHFPFELVANMSCNNQPSEGLTFLAEKEGDGNKFARFARWLNELGPSDESRPGYCKRVVRLDSLKNTKASQPIALNNNSARSGDQIDESKQASR
jgi:esterase/lipase superfamily enzyme